MFIGLVAFNGIIVTAGLRAADTCFGVGVGTITTFWTGVRVKVCPSSAAIDGRCHRGIDSNEHATRHDRVGAGRLYHDRLDDRIRLHRVHLEDLEDDFGDRHMGHTDFHYGISE